jgi:hypothetical protein
MLHKHGCTLSKTGIRLEFHRPMHSKFHCGRPRGNSTSRLFRANSFRTLRVDSDLAMEPSHTHRRLSLQFI